MCEFDQRMNRGDLLYRANQQNSKTIEIPSQYHRTIVHMYI